MQIPARIWRGSVDLSFMENMQMRKRLLALALTAVLIGAQALPVPAEEGAEIYDEELLPEGEEEEIIEALIDDGDILTDPEEELLPADDEEIPELTDEVEEAEELQTEEEELLAEPVFEEELLLGDGEAQAVTYVLKTDGWTEDALPGSTAVLTPRIMKCAEDAEPADVTDAIEGVTYTLTWHEGQAGSIEDPCQVVITDADGKTLAGGKDTGAPPFSVERADRSEGSVLIEAAFTADGIEQQISEELPLRPVSRSIGYRAEGGFASDDGRYVRYFIDGDNPGEIIVKPVTADIDDLMAAHPEITLEAEAGRIVWNSVENAYDLIPVDGFSFTQEEFSAAEGLHLTDSARITELRDALDAAGGADGVDLMIRAALNGRTIAEDGIHVSITRTYLRLEDDGASVLTGNSFYYPEGKSTLYMEDAAHFDPNQADSAPGTVFPVTITDIASSDPSVLKSEKAGNDWYLRALKKGEAKITYTFTGGPDGINTHETTLYVKEDLFFVSVIDENGDEAACVRKLTGETGSLAPVIIRSHYDAAKGRNVFNTITKDNAAAFGYTFGSRLPAGWEYDGDKLDLDAVSGSYTLKKEGDVDLSLEAWLQQNGEEIFRGRADVRIEIRARLFAWRLDDSAIIYVTPGQKVALGDIKSMIPEKASLRSAEDPKGAEVPITAYWFGGAEGPLLTDGQTLTVPEDALKKAPAEDDGSVVAGVWIGARDKDGNEGSDLLQVVIHEHGWEALPAVAPTCTETGLTEGLWCPVCGEIKVSQKEVPATGHLWDKGKITTAATVFKEGVRTYTCKHDAAHTKTKKLAKLTPKMSFNFTGTLPVQKGKTTSGAKVTGLARGDAVKSVKSSSKKILKASFSGKTLKLTGKKKGTATVTVTLKSGLKKSFKVKVQKSKVKTKKINNLVKNVTLKVKKTLALKPAILPVTTLDALTFKSSKPSVASVSANGVITALKKGTAKITVKSGKKRFVVTVKVKKAS